MFRNIVRSQLSGSPTNFAVGEDGGNVKGGIGICRGEGGMSAGDQYNSWCPGVHSADGTPDSHGNH